MSSRIWALPVTIALCGMGISGCGGVKAGNPGEAAPQARFSVDLGPNQNLNLSALTICTSQLRLTSLGGSTEINLSAAEISIADSGKALATVEVPVGSYSRAELDISSACASGKSVSLTNTIGAYVSTDAIMFRFEGPFTVSPSLQTITLDLQPIADQLSLITDSSQIKTAAESVTGEIKAFNTISWAGSSSITVGSCQGYVIQSLNSEAESVPISSVATSYMTLSSSPGGYQAAQALFYSDASCTTEIEKATFTAGTAVANVYVRALRDGLFALYAYPDWGVIVPTPGSMAITASPAAQSALVVTGPTYTGAGTCSAAYLTTLQDAFGNPRPATSAIQVDLSATGSGTRAFYGGSDDACSGSAITGLSISVGESSASFRFRDSASENITITASDQAAALSSGSFAAGIGAAATIRLGTGAEHTCASVDGAVKCWGYNRCGQLGDGTSLRSLVPISVGSIASGATALEAGLDHTCSIVSGAVKCWGANSSGELGNGSVSANSCVNGASANFAPSQVTGLTSGVQSISVGNIHSCAITGTNELMCWGNNLWSKLGDGTSVHRDSPVFVLNPSGSGHLTGVTSVSAGAEFTCAVASGAAYCWGSNVYGQLGFGSSIEFSALPVQVSGLGSGVSSIEASGIHACALMASGSVYCWGSNQDTRLGQGSSPVSVSHTPLQVKNSAGTGYLSGVLALTASGSPSPRYSGQTCALLSGGSVQCWGLNYYGQLGDGTLLNRALPTSVLTLSSGVSIISAGDAFTCAIQNGNVLCWGDNHEGEFGNGAWKNTTSPAPISSLR
jgi:alpha-tubulin suppressor-like RCC1 family protein